MTNGSLGGIVIATAMVCLVLYPVLQFFALRSKSLLWRLLGLVPMPLLAYAGWASYQGYVANAGLWPLLLIFGLPLAAVYLGVVLFARYLSSRPS